MKSEKKGYKYTSHKLKLHSSTTTGPVSISEQTLVFVSTLSGVTTLITSMFVSLLSLIQSTALNTLFSLWSSSGLGDSMQEVISRGFGFFSRRQHALQKLRGVNSVLMENLVLSVPLAVAQPHFLPSFFYIFVPVFHFF